jgi:hypothetical protein
METESFKQYRTNQKELDLALAWFAEEDISAYQDNGKIYITVGEYDYEISSDEINYRAELVEENMETEDE